MRVGLYNDWVRHLKKSEDEQLVAWPRSGNGPDHQVWIVSSSDKKRTYTVVYHANAYEQFISCDCPAGSRDVKCKHAAMVLAIASQGAMRQARKEAA